MGPAAAEFSAIETPFTASSPYVQLLVLLVFNTAIFIGAALVQKAFQVDILPMVCDRAALPPERSTGPSMTGANPIHLATPTPAAAPGAAAPPASTSAQRVVRNGRALPPPSRPSPGTAAPHQQAKWNSTTRRRKGTIHGGRLLSVVHGRSHSLFTRLLGKSHRAAGRGWSGAAELYVGADAQRPGRGLRGVRPCGAESCQGTIVRRRWSAARGADAARQTLFRGVGRLHKGPFRPTHGDASPRCTTPSRCCSERAGGYRESVVPGRIRIAVPTDSGFAFPF